MRRRIVRALITSFIAPFIIHSAPAAPPEGKLDAATIDRWIAQLGDDEFDKREEASKRLEAAGEASLPALHAAAESSPDAEVRSRAKKIVAVIEKDMWPEVRNFFGGNPNYWFNRVAFAADGKQAIVTGGGVYLYDLETGKQIYGGVMELQFARRGLSLSKDGSRFLTGHQNDPVVRLCDVKTGKEVQTFVGHAAGVWATALSPDGSLAVSGGGDKTIRIWEAKTGKELRCCEGVTYGVVSLAFAPKGDRFASGQGSGGDPFQVRLWDAATGKEVRVFKGHTGNVNGLAFLPDGKTLLSASSDGTVRMWDVDGGKEIRQMKHDGAVYDVAVSPDGKRALSAGYDDKTVRLWNLTTGREIHRFTEHTTRVLGVAFSPDGKRGLSCDAGMTVRLWRLEK